MKKVFIDGQAGTTGLQLAQRLAGHGEVEVMAIQPEKRKDEEARQALMNQADVVFLCLPDQAAREAVELIHNPHTVVIDTSTAHRVNPGWAYGFSELSPVHTQKIAQGQRIANPGCHATGFIAAAYPLVKLGLVPADYPFSCHSITGYSGGGRKMIEQYQAPDRPQGLSSPRAYALSLAHKHLPEMQQVPGLTRPPLFEPIVCDFYCGMEVALPLRLDLLPGHPTVEQIEEGLCSFYADSPLIQVERPPEDGFLPANLMAGKDGLKLYVTGSGDMALVVSLLDNLGKGAAGAAVQNMNLALGFDPLASLRV